MKDIGGYLELENLVKHEYHSNLVALNTARNALIYLCNTKSISKIYLPYFLCDSVSGVCQREKVNYNFYHINENFQPDFDEKLGENEYLYIVNYYGQLTQSQIESYKQKYINIIVDNVQAFFQKPVDGVDTIYSCRKFFGVPDGAYLSTNKRNLYDLERDQSKDRMSHILGRYEGNLASEYYADFKANDHSFEELPLRAMSKLTHNILGAIDYDSVRQKRNENYRVLSDCLGARNQLKLIVPDAPYMYPFYCENGMQVKKELVEKKIYIPTLWPNLLENKCAVAKEFSNNILPLPVDQRYSVDDMIYLYNELSAMCNK